MRLFFAIPFLLLFLGGCQDKPPVPKTYPVSGKVFDSKGVPVTDGVVQFESKTPGNLTISGLILSDGTFTLKTFRDKDEEPGAPEGEYQAVITLPIKSGNLPPPPEKIKGPFRVEAKENKFELRFGQ